MRYDIKTPALTFEPIKVDEDYVFGGGLSILPKVILQPDHNWLTWLPQEERQAPNFETYACVSETTTNIEEILEKRLFGNTINDSARFLASISGTKVGGNSPHTVMEFRRKLGAIPEELYPTNEAESFEQYYQRVAPKLYEEARKRLSKRGFGHEYVPTSPEALYDALQFSPLGVSVYAWVEDNGWYVKPDGVTDTHLTTLAYGKKGEYWNVFDTYAPFIKKLPWDYKFSVAKRISLAQIEGELKDPVTILTTLRWLFDYLKIPYGKIKGTH